MKNFLLSSRLRPPPPQCLIIATDCEGSGFGPGMQGKLQKLTMVDLDLSEPRIGESTHKASHSPFVP